MTNIMPDDHIWGFIPMMLNTDNPKSAAEQLNDGYQHGGGYNNQDGWGIKQKANGEYYATYSGDPSHDEVDSFMFRDECIVMFPHAYVAVVQQDGSFVMGRMD